MLLPCIHVYQVRVTLSGEQVPQWSREDLIQYCEPKYGYTRDSPTFLQLVEVLLELEPDQRKNFLTFATGCPTLPPGGLCNLNPRLTVVCKSSVEEDADHTFPSVNT